LGFNPSYEQRVQKSAMHGDVESDPIEDSADLRIMLWFEM
jgi:hypothetical protein